MNKIIFLIIKFSLILLLVLIFLPKNLYAAEWLLDGKLTFGSGYSSNSYIDSLADKYIQRAWGLGYIVTGTEQKLDSKLNLSASYEVRAFYGFFGFGISTGFYGTIDKKSFHYQKSTDLFSIGKTTVASYMLPQTANFYFKANINEKNSLHFGIGSGDYLYLNYREGKINKVNLMQNNNLVYGDYFARFPHEYFILTNGKTVEHDFGAQASIEYSYQINYTFSVQAGVKGLYIFNNSGNSLAVHLVIGVTSRLLGRYNYF